MKKVYPKWMKNLNIYNTEMGKFLGTSEDYKQFLRKISVIEKPKPNECLVSSLIDYIEGSKSNFNVVDRCSRIEELENYISKPEKWHKIEQYIDAELEAQTP